MKSLLQSGAVFYFSIFIGAILIFVGVSYLFSDIFAYILISVVLATILRPMVDQISGIQFLRFKFPRVLAIFISFCILCAFIYFFTLLFVPLISDQLKVLSDLNFEKMLSKIAQPLNNLEYFLIDNRIVREEKGFLIDNVQQYIIDLLHNFEFSALLNNAFSLLGSIFIAVLAVSFMTFFFLMEKGLLRRLFLKMIPNSYFELTVTAFYKIEQLLSNYLIGLLFQMIAIFSVASILLSIVGINYALTIAIFAAIANLIPYLGPVLGASFGLLVSLSTAQFGLEFQSYAIIIIKVLSVFGSIQLLDNILFQPIIFSRSVKAHPLEIFVIVFVGATLAGPIGMILAIPSYTILRVSVIEFYLGYQDYRIFKIDNVNI